MIAFGAEENPLFNPVNTDNIWLTALALLGAAVGVYLFFYGFRMLQYKRLILNTPFSKIRSASMGLVEVSGTTTGPKTIPAGITGSPCYYYRARAWQWVQSDSGRGGSWRHVVEESLSVPFFLDDGTGKVLINPQGATLDVHRSFKDEFRTSYLLQSSPIPESVRKFVALHGLMAGDKVRLEEYIIKPGFPLFVFGTLGDNTMLHSWSAEPHVSGKKISFGLSFGDSANLKFARGASVSNIATKALASLLQSAASGKTRTSISISRSGDGPVDVPEDLLTELHQAGLNLPFPVSGASGKMTVFSRTSGEGLLRSNAVQVRITPGPATATDVAEQPPQPEANQNAGDFDLRARVALSKGERGDPFMISSQSQREVVQSLGWKSAGCIWGGPVFALICLYCLFTIWGWM
jgi:E3 Ubiquitin ligase